MNFKFLSVLFLLFLSMSMTSDQKIIILGNVMMDLNLLEEDQPILMILKNGDQIVKQTKIEKDLTFNLSSSLNGICDLYYKEFGGKEVYIQPIKTEKSDTLKISFSLPKEYHKDDGKVNCPKCNLKDQTIEIAYGLKSIVIYDKNPPNYITYDGYGKEEIYDGGCGSSPLAAQYFCKRDSIKF